MLSSGQSRLDACSEGGVSGFLPRKTMVSDGCASKFPWCKFLFSTNVLWYSKTIDLAALRWLSSRGMDKSEIKKAITVTKILDIFIELPVTSYILGLSYKYKLLKISRLGVGLFIPAYVTQRE